jgi:hypothetical protein
MPGINDYGKLLILLVALSGGLVLAIVGVVTEDDASTLSGVGICTTIIGYVTGNGRLASRTEPPQPLLSPKLPTDEFVHIDELDPTIKRQIVMHRVQQAQTRRAEQHR